MAQMMSEQSITIDREEELRKVVDILLERIGAGHTVFLLSGDLGAGKTTLVQHLGRALGVGDTISSPTFGLIQAYQLPDGDPVYHMDLYRIAKPDDLVQLGLEEYLDSGSLCLIEWPAVAISHFPARRVEVDIHLDIRNLRTFRITTHDTVDA